MKFVLGIRIVRTPMIMLSGARGGVCKRYVFRFFLYAPAEARDGISMGINWVWVDVNPNNQVCRGKGKNLGYVVNSGSWIC